MTNRNGKILGLVALAVLAGLVVYRWYPGRAPAGPAVATVAAPRPATPLLPPANVDQSGEATAAQLPVETSSTLPAGPSPVFAAFLDWSVRYLAASPAARPGMLDEGLQRARERRVVLARLIRTDPRAALEAAVPMTVRQELPAEIVALLEERVSGRGELALNGVSPAPGQTVTEPVFRSALIDRREYRAYVYGRRAAQSTVPAASLVGIALDGSMAVSESPLRLLEAGELPAGRPLDVVCAISGDATPVAADSPLNLQAPTAVEYNGKIQVLCHPEHVAVLEQRLIASDRDETVNAADNQPGSSGVTGRPTLAWTTGTKKLLIIRVDFSDHTDAGFPVITEDTAVNLINSANGVKDYYVGNSYGQTTLQIAATAGGDSPDVTGVLRMPQTGSYYALGDGTNAYNSTLHSDARAAALAAGFAVDTYDRIGVVFSNIGTAVFPSSKITYGGLGNITGRNFWVNGFYQFGIVAHELGHTYGLNHANLWQVADGNPVSPAGTSTEYGDVFDVMGGGGSFQYDFSHWNKSILQWIPDTAVTLASAAGTYRIYRFDAAAANLANARALKIVRDSTRDYWIGYRRGSGNASLSGGAYVLWGYNSNQQGNLLDMTTPGTTVTNAGLAVGTPFNDTAAGITITPLAQGGSGAEEYLDVQVAFQPRIQWAQAEFIVDEQGGSAVLSLTRSSNSTGAVSVNYATSPGTALAPDDYTTQSGTVSWANGDSATKTITIPIAPDALVEGSESFTVTLSGVTGGVVVGSAATTVTIADAGARDASFAPEFVNSTVEKVLPLPDGSVIIGGWFDRVHDGATSRRGITRLLTSGAVDTDFASDGGPGSFADAFATNVVYDLARQPDGRIIAVGKFTTYDGASRNRVVRLLPDGALDPSFTPGTGASDIVYAVLVQPDGKILIGGAFISYSGIAREYLARLNSDGTLDTGFVGPDFADVSGWRVESLALQNDGKLLVGGSFYFSGSPFKSGLCRVLTTGAIDSSFNGITNGAHLSGSTGSLRTVYDIVVQPDGQILVAGNFTAFNNSARGGLARLTSTGALDGSFVPTSDNACNAILLQPDGKILVGGDFTTFNGSMALHLARLSSAGVFDTAFSAPGGLSNPVSDLALLPDGRVVLGGDFGTFQGSSNSRPVWRLFAGLPGRPGTIQFASATYSGNEGTSIVASVTRTGGSLGVQTVGYATVSGTATTADYTATNGVLTWADGDAAAKTITIPLTTDALAETPELFTVNLGQPVLNSGLLGTTQQTVVSVISATNTPPTASFSLSSERVVGQTITATVNVGDTDGNYSYANLWVNTPGRGWLTIKADNSTVASSALSAANTVAVSAGTVARTFAMTPADGAGTYLFALAAVDGAGAQTFAANQYITVTSANVAPSATFSLSSQRTVGQTLTVTVNVGDTDGNYSYANLWVNSPGRGWLTIKADNSTVASSALSAANTVAAAAGTVTRTFTFTPADGAGSYLFALAAVDSAGLQTFAANQYITVTSSNVAPTASFSLSSQRTVGQTITATVNVGDTDGNYSYANLWVNSPGRGWLTIKADNSTVASSALSAANTVAAAAGTVTRTFTFTPADGAGSYLFALAAVDSAGAQTFAANQYITVTSANVAPTATFSLSSERAVGQTITATVNVGDTDGNYSYANLWVNSPGRGWLTIKADSSTVASSALSAANTVAASAGTVTRTFTFTPADGAGSYLFALAAVDSAGAQTFATNQYITVTSSNVAPTATFSLSSERAVGQTITATVNVGDTDGNYSYANLWVNSPGRGWLTIKADNSTVASSSLSAANTVAATAGTVTRTFTFTPADGAGSYLFALAAVDSAGLQTFATNQYITVTAANAAPTASFSLSSERSVGQTITVTVNVGDPDGNYSFANLWVNTPGRGWLVIKANNSTVASSALSAANTVAAAAGTVTRTFTFTPADGAGTYLFALAAVDTMGLQTFATNQYIMVVPQVLFADDFAAALNTTNWVQQTDDSSSASIWATSGGVLTGYYPLTLSAATNTQSFLNLGNALQPTGDWRASFDFTWSPDVGNATLGSAIADFGLWLSTSAKLSLSAGFAGPVASSGARANITVNVQSWNGTSWSSLSSSTVALNWTPSMWNTATLVKQGSVYHLSINNTEVLQFTDNVLSGTGKLGLHAAGTRTVDDFLLEQL